MEQHLSCEVRRHIPPATSPPHGKRDRLLFASVSFPLADFAFVRLPTVADKCPSHHWFPPSKNTTLAELLPVIKFFFFSNQISEYFLTTSMSSTRWCDQAAMQTWWIMAQHRSGTVETGPHCFIYSTFCCAVSANPRRLAAQSTELIWSLITQQPSCWAAEVSVIKAMMAFRTRGVLMKRNVITFTSSGRGYLKGLARLKALRLQRTEHLHSVWWFNDCRNM